ncbi:glycoside hydrolase family 85 protein [Agrocybe pediades]|nr:glycoside hydrolase family 85 protein [Agrocybe pediades]
MPTAGATQPPAFERQYFKSLQELDEWAPGRSATRYEGVQKFIPRRPNAEALKRGRLLQRSQILTYCSFSHHRVTVPPPGWVSAAHRQGVKMLGTLIFEGGGEEDTLRLLLGKTPTSVTGRNGRKDGKKSVPVSAHYVKVLAELARERGFDGYLLNFECPLTGQLDQARPLAAWISILQSELLEKVGPHAETIWYDSVVINGELQWQDRLNSVNLPFFLPSTGFFTNYTWPNFKPDQTAKYFESLPAELVGNTPQSHVHAVTKTVRDLYIGVDVWGRGSHGGGGYGLYKAMEHIAPRSSGLSVALFGQAWTWESEQDKQGWIWDNWWAYEMKLWIGPPGGDVPVPESKPKRGEPECSHGEFTPISSFFTPLSPPDPFDARFSTSFCPGTGLAWFVEGTKVYESQSGWTDVGKQTSVGNLLWPNPTLFWDDARTDDLPTASSAFCFDDAWTGGNSIRVSISLPGSEDELAAYRPLWLPVQSLHITREKIYEATFIYKLDNDSTSGLDLEFALGFKPVVREAGQQPDPDVEWNVISSATTDLHNGWTKLHTIFNTTTSNGGTSPCPTDMAAGLVVAIVAEEPTQPAKLSFLLGQLNVFAHVPPAFKEEEAVILWADMTPSASGTSSRFEGTLSWDVFAELPQAKIELSGQDDPKATWNGQPTLPWFPSFLYFNIYARLMNNDSDAKKDEKPVWIGTSGWDGQRNGFDVRPENLPFSVPRGGKVRFFVQGVNDCGEVMKWDNCAFVDVV